MKNELWVTEQVPKGAVILLVDVQEKYFLEGDLTQKIKQRIKNRIDRMRTKLYDLKRNGHTIYAVNDTEGIHPHLQGIPDFYLQAWNYQSVSSPSLDPVNRYIIHPQIVNILSTASTVVVCGLWRELCLFTVTRLLQKERIRTYLSVDSSISLENAILWEDEDTITLDSECRACNVQIRTKL